MTVAKKCAPVCPRERRTTVSLKSDCIRNCNLLTCKSVFHAGALAHHVLVVVTLFQVQLEGHHDRRVTDLIPYRFFTLTGWMFSFQIAYLVFALSVDIDQWCGRNPSKVWIRDLVFSALVFPFTMGVATIFWPLYLWDREVIYPEVWDTLVPSWINVGMHGLTVPVAIFELMLEPRRPPDSRKAQLILHWAISITYTAVVYGVRGVGGVWLYPFLDRLSWSQRCIFQTCFSGCGHLYYELQWSLAAAIHRRIPK